MVERVPQEAGLDALNASRESGRGGVASLLSISQMAPSTFFRATQCSPRWFAMAPTTASSSSTFGLRCNIRL